jgi:hypothetical protein
VGGPLHREEENPWDAPNNNANSCANKDSDDGSDDFFMKEEERMKLINSS